MCQQIKSILVKERFKEKQKELFDGIKRSELPLLEFLIDHKTDSTSYDDSSLELMSRMLENNLRDFNIEVEVVSVKLVDQLLLYLKLIQPKGLR